MWMQVLEAAGLEVFGPKFLPGWEDKLEAANERGFYESHLRQGVYFGTNPHPSTGVYLRREDLHRKVVKIFVPGVVRSEFAYIECLIANLRPWREFVSSRARLYAIEDEGRDPALGARPHLPAELEWWNENYALIRDLRLRRYPVRLFSYEHVLRDPRFCVGKALELIGEGDLDAAMASIAPEARTQRAPEIQSDLDPESEATFDALYEAVDSRRGFSAELIAAMDATQARLGPGIRAAWAEVERALAEGSAQNSEGRELPRS